MLLIRKEICFSLLIRLHKLPWTIPVLCMCQQEPHNHLDKDRQMDFQGKTELLNTAIHQVIFFMRMVLYLA